MISRSCNTLKIEFLECTRERVCWCVETDHVFIVDLTCDTSLHDSDLVVAILEQLQLSISLEIEHNGTFPEDVIHSHFANVIADQLMQIMSMVHGY